MPKYYFSFELSRYGGSGLGLFICKGLIELMGGEITVNSKKFHGTKFHFTAKCQVNVS